MSSQIKIKSCIMSNQNHALSLSAPVFTQSAIPLFSTNQTVTLPQTPIFLSQPFAIRSYPTAINQSNNITATEHSNDSLKYEIENMRKTFKPLKKLYNHQ